MVAAELENRSGRTWRPLGDTSISVQTLNEAPVQWSNWRRGLDYYDEGELIWLEADMTIRQISNGEKSLDNFAKAFFGAPPLSGNAAPTFKPYTFDEVVNTLNQVVPYDWKKFLNDRIWSTSPHAPLGGIEASGWRLAYVDKPDDILRTRETLKEYVDVSFSIGLIVQNDGSVLDSFFLKPAAEAGITPGMKLIAVNGRKFNDRVLRDAIRDAKGAEQPVELLIQNADYFKTYRLNYHEGEKYPLLERNEKPDTLTAIIKAHAAR
jgi:predicted metalloprotease with PDZ domain